MDKKLLQYYYNCVDKAITLYWRTLSKARGMKLVKENIEYVISDNRNSPERIFNIQIPPENAEQRINELIEEIMAGKIPDSLLITPNTMPENLAELLNERGFVIDTSGSCMILDLCEIGSMGTNLEGIRVSEIFDLNDFKNK